MMERFVSIFVLLFICSTVQSQVKSELVLAKYNNGLLYVGEKVSEKENFISIRINTTDTIQINRHLLSKYYDSKTALIFPNGKHIQTAGSFWDLSFGFNALGILDSVDQRVSSHIEVIYGRRINENFNFGISAGFEFNEANVAGFQFDTQFTSLSVYGRYYLNNSSKRLFVFSRIGAGFPAENTEEGITVEHTGGFNSLNGLGIHFASRNRSTFQIMLGFYTQKTEGREFFLDNIGNEILTDFDILIKRLMFKFGWEFG